MHMFFLYPFLMHSFCRLFILLILVLNEALAFRLVDKNNYTGKKFIRGASTLFITK